MKDNELRFRQVHLDFHTSEYIEGIGANFDPDEFAETLKRAHVNSINVFGRGHHGWMYFDSEAFPERVHPHLANPKLLDEQIAACHKRDIRIPIYLTVQWDLYTARRHPEWAVLGPDGRLDGTGPYEPGFYRSLCVNTPYRDFLREHAREVLERFDVDGMWFDIVSPRDCSCSRCLPGMRAEGLDASDKADRMRYAAGMLHDWQREMSAWVRRFNEDCLIFYNSGHIGPRHRSIKDAYTHWELESLPSGGWGYMHFPTAQRYARTLGPDSVGMTGKFHTSWGDFHSFKTPAALEFECFHMLALNAKCCVGDQLHHSGRICPVTYDLIGSVYRQIEMKEPWCAAACPLVDIAVLTPEEFAGPTGHRGMPPAAMGAVRMLQEGACQFDVVDSQAKFSNYKVLVLPDEIPVSKELAAKIESHLAAGGSLLASYRSGLNERGDGFAIDGLGVRLKGDAPFSPDFIVPKGAIGAGLPGTEHVMYMRGLQVAATGEAKVLAKIVPPYFNRTWEHFCSHRHTPSAGPAVGRGASRKGYPGIVHNGRAIYFAHPVFGQYHANAPLWCKKLVINALDILLPDPLVRLEAPSSTIAALNEQPARKRWVLHLLHYIPERRGTAFDVIEDVIAIHDVKVSVKTPKEPASVTCVPEGRALDFETKDGRTCFTLPTLNGHQMIELGFA